MCRADLHPDWHASFPTERSSESSSCHDFADHDSERARTGPSDLAGLFVVAIVAGVAMLSRAGNRPTFVETVPASIVRTGMLGALVCQAKIC